MAEIESEHGRREGRRERERRVRAAGCRCAVGGTDISVPMHGRVRGRRARARGEGGERQGRAGQMETWKERRREREGGREDSRGPFGSKCRARRCGRKEGQGRADSVREQGSARTGS
eukprot:2242495-Rhodomonas_salina.1